MYAPQANAFHSQSIAPPSTTVLRAVPLPFPFVLARRPRDLEKLADRD
jgi:hypothetical protein